MSSLLDTALLYRDAGLSVIGASDKGTITKWKKYQTELPTDTDLNYFFQAVRFSKLAIICGESSGNLEVIDVDTKYDRSGRLWNELWEWIVNYYKGNPPFAIVETQSKGIHIYYRCTTIGRNDELAKVDLTSELTPEEIESGKKKKIRAVIETRGMGGYVIGPPSPGYTSLDNRIPHQIPTITPEEREDIFAFCRTFNKVFHEEPTHHPIKSSSAYKKTPWHEYNQSDEFKSVLKSAGWTFTHQSGDWDYYRRPGKESGHSASWNRVTRQFYVFSSSSEFEVNKGYRPFDILKILGHDDNLSAAVRSARDAGFGETFTPLEQGLIAKSRTMFNSGNLIDDIRDMLSFDFDAAIKQQRDIDPDQILKTAHQLSIDGQDVFWFEDEDGKLHLEKAAIADYLNHRGFRLLVDHDDAHNFKLVRISENIIQYIAPDQLRKHIDESLYEAAGNASIRQLRNLVHGIPDATINTAIAHLPRLPIDRTKFLIKGGDEKVQWFAFRNGAVRVTAKDIDIIPYNELPPGILVWKRNIKPFDFERSDIELEQEFNESVIWLFFKRICGITKEIQHLDHQTELAEQYPDLHARFITLITAIGYLLSTYKNTDESFMPIFEEDIEQSAKGGGTGKGLILKIIGFMRNVVDLNCKVWNPSRPFPYQKVTVETDVIHYNDYEPSKWKIGDINNDITEGLDIENKYEGQFHIPFAQSPKSAATSNYRIPDEEEFASRRQKKIYLIRYFSKLHRPKNEFGKEFGRGKDWTDDDWQITYNILIYCLQAYLSIGVQESTPSINITRKAVIESYGQEFMDFIENYLNDYKGKWVLRKELYHEFLEDTETDKKFMSSRRFNNACQMYAEKMGLEHTSLRNKKGVHGDRDQLYLVFADRGQVPEFENKYIKGAPVF